MLRLYDSLSRELREIAADPHRPLGVYSCGPTVYDRIHVGNARPFVLAMTLKRHLERSGIAVKLVVNITDVNDKIDLAARRLNVPSSAHAAAMTAAYIADTSRLGLGRPDVEPRVTETIAEIIELVEGLIERGLAYPAAGSVYFRVGRFPSYGALSGQRTDALLAEGRVEPGAGKESHLDFALWKGREAGEDVSWPSPWGEGRPAWHIECSAMAIKHLGLTVDVHGGGTDLIFPHHENEIAQAEPVTGQAFVRTWMHNGMLRFAGDKMSKSLGNVETLADAIDRWGAETILGLLAQAHYRSAVDFTEETLMQAQQANAGLKEALRSLRRASGSGAADALLIGEAEQTARRFDLAMDDDLRTPVALAELFGLRSSANSAIASGRLSSDAGARVADLVVSRLDVLGLAGLDAGEAAVPSEVLALAQEREAARARRDFARSDALRDEIAVLGYEARDRPGGFELVPR